MTRTAKILIAGIVAVALSAGAVAIAQAVDEESGAKVTSAQREHAERAALEVVKRGHVVSVEHDNAGLAAWKVRIFKPIASLEGNDTTSDEGHYVAVYLDRNYEWLMARGERYRSGL
jgi:hypothetical protein